MSKCRISNTINNSAFSLGDLFISDFVKTDYFNKESKYDLSLCFNDESKLLQLEKSTNIDLMFGKYWYRSGLNNSMREALNNVVLSSLSYKKMEEGDVWLDIASNDGTLLSFVPKNIIRIGIDPAEDSFKNEAMRYSDLIIQDYFNANIYKNSKYGNKKAKIITAIAMFYDLNDPISFLKGIEEIMDDDGLLVLQLSYTPLMIDQLAFDNICHEHVCYYSLTSLKYLLDKTNFTIIDCELNDVNGGSFRVYIKKKIYNIKKFKTAPFRDVANFRIQSLFSYEENNGFNNIEKYFDFYEKIVKLKNETVLFIKKQKSLGKKIWGYGASTKGNTLLQWYGLDNSIIDGIAECSPYKYGLKTIGTNIPIYSEEVMRNQNPDFVLILPWHFINEFKKREAKYLQNGGRFIVPCPKFEILGE